ncbi:Hypothetical predicted protein, partial [Podarcis lilfordi]
FSATFPCTAVNLSNACKQLNIKRLQSEKYEPKFPSLLSWGNQSILELVTKCMLGLKIRKADMVLPLPTCPMFRDDEMPMVLNGATVPQDYCNALYVGLPLKKTSEGSSVQVQLSFPIFHCNPMFISTQLTGYGLFVSLHKSWLKNGNTKCWKERIYHTTTNIHCSQTDLEGPGPFQACRTELFRLAFGLHSHLGLADRMVGGSNPHGGRE